MKRSILISISIVMMLMFPVMGVSAMYWWGDEPTYTPVHESWDPTIGDTYDFTAGYDLNITLPQAAWDAINSMSEDMLAAMIIGGQWPEGEQLDVEDVIESAIDEFAIVQARFKVENMSGIELSNTYWDYGEGKNVTDSYDYDWFNVSMQAKRPSDSTFGEPDDLALSFFDSIEPFINAHLPATLAANLTDPSVLNRTAVEQELTNATYAPMETYWLADMNLSDSDIPPFAKELGFFAGPMSSDGVPLFVPKDWNIGQAWGDFKSWLLFPHPEEGLDEAIINSTSFPSNLDELFAQFGLSVEVREKQIQSTLDLSKLNETYINELLTDMYGSPFNLTEQKNAFVTMYQEALNSALSAYALPLSFELNPDDFNLQIFENVKYDSNGILENAHVELVFSITNGTSKDLIAFNVLADVSAGLHNSVGATYGGVLEDTKDLKGGDAADLEILGEGNQTVDVDTGDVGVGIQLNITTLGDVGVIVQAWIDNPAAESGLGGSGNDTGLAGDASQQVFFSIDVTDESKVEFPIVLLVDIPEGVDPYKLGCMTWDEGLQEWVDAGFEIYANEDKTKAVILVTHLSVFAVGEVLPSQIPGFDLLFVSMAAIAAMGYIFLKKRQVIEIA